MKPVPVYAEPRALYVAIAAALGVRYYARFVLGLRRVKATHGHA